MQRGKDAKRRGNIKTSTTMRQCVYASMRLLAINFLLFTSLCTPIFALELDTSIDEEIRKNYNPNKIEEDMGLPELPKILKSTQQNTNKSPQQIISQTPSTQLSTEKRVEKPKPIEIPKTGNCAVIKQGTRIQAKLLTNISDRSKKGSKVSFVSRYPITTTYLTIPSGTIFYGTIEDVHKPQLAGNGGLIVIQVKALSLNGQKYAMEGYITEANNKLIFLNSIKGQRKFMKNAVNATKPGRNFFRKMCHVTSNLASDKSSMILTPFPVVLGLASLGGNIIISPAISLFQKGGSIHLNEGCNIEIKLSSDLTIYN